VRTPRCVIERADLERPAQMESPHRARDAEGDLHRFDLAADPRVVRGGEADAGARGGERARMVGIEADAERRAAEVDDRIAMPPAAEYAAFVRHRQRDRGFAGTRRAKHEADDLLRQAARAGHALGRPGKGPVGPADPSPARFGTLADRNLSNGATPAHLLGPDQIGEGEWARPQLRALRPGCGEQRQRGDGGIDPQSSGDAAHDGGDDAVAADDQLAPGVAGGRVARRDQSEGRSQKKGAPSEHVHLPPGAPAGTLAPDCGGIAAGSRRGGLIVLAKCVLLPARQFGRGL